MYEQGVHLEQREKEKEKPPKTFECWLPYKKKQSNIQVIYFIPDQRNIKGLRVIT